MGEETIRYNVMHRNVQKQAVAAPVAATTTAAAEPVAADANGEQPM